VRQLLIEEMKRVIGALKKDINKNFEILQKSRNLTSAEIGKLRREMSDKKNQRDLIENDVIDL
jgi:hypothetical protein